MKLHVINTGYFKLDGGAMFGVVPRTMWQKLNPPDANNLCTWALRCLLIEDGDRLILIDNGIGDKQSEKFFSHYFLHGGDSLIGSLNKAGFTADDITDVFMTHLHFDHCGGGVNKVGEDKYKLTFPNATYWSNESHWNWALTPNPRERASFLKENIVPIQESGNLKFIDPGTDSPFPQFDIFFADGHTEKQMIPLIKYQDKTVAFMADLLPSAAHIRLPYVMAYDVRPLQTMVEKKEFLTMAEKEDFFLFLEHDPLNEVCTLKPTERGIALNNTFSLKHIL